jgi:NAD+ kinase
MKIPRILVVYKRSSLSVAGSLASRLRTIERFKANHAAHFATLRAVEKVLTGSGIPYHKHARGPRVDYAPYELIITVGGDGTVLEAARAATRRQVILGVNSDPCWSVGQFCYADAATFELFLKRFLAGRARVCRVHKLKICLKDGKRLQRMECLNDVLVCHANPAAMSRYVIAIGRQKEEQKDSGIWISSAAGSTGAIASGGGARMPLSSTDIQYKPRELYHSRATRYHLSGGCVKRPGRIVLVSMMPRGLIFVDGSHIRFPFTYGSRAEISSSENFVQLVHA